MKRLVVFSGAGVSAESGLNTFRDSGGLWEEYDVMDVATPEAWAQNPEMVLEFYNKRRTQILNASPNKAHELIASLEQMYDVDVITQNIDDLHERAGSGKVLHLHGEITKSRSTYPPFKTYPIKGDCLNWGDKCASGFQLRPHVVWFGEAVPLVPLAEEIIAGAEIVIVVGTSLNVFPAAGIVNAASKRATIYLIDPNNVKVRGLDYVVHIKKSATEGMEDLYKKLSSVHTA